MFCLDFFFIEGLAPSLKEGAPEHLCVCVCVRQSVFWGMPLDVVIAPAEDCFWPDLQDTDMRLKIRVRRMKEGRELRGVYSPGFRAGEVKCVCVRVCASYKSMSTSSQQSEDAKIVECDLMSGFDCWGRFLKLCMKAKACDNGVVHCR